MRATRGARFRGERAYRTTQCGRIRKEMLAKREAVNVMHEGLKSVDELLRCVVDVGDGADGQEEVWEDDSD